MRWLTGMAAGTCTGIAILAVIYGLNHLDHWHSPREASLAHLAMLERDTGYPNREASIKSEREQIEILAREVTKSSAISAVVLVISLGAFVLLWRRASRSFSAVRLAILVEVAAVAILSCLGLALVMLSAGVMRG